jgi:glutathione S-transferase
MKLYMHAAACSLSPHIVARELGLPIELVDVDRTTHKTPSGDDYLELNSMGYVPGLALDDGRLLLEGPAIVQYLADLRPDAGLAPPAGTPERTALQMILNFIASEIHKPLAMLFDPVYRPVQAALHAKIEKRFDWIAARLAPYTMGAQFSVADPYLFVCLNWTQLAGPSLDARPALLGFMRAVGERPHVRAALAAEDLVIRDPASPYFLPRHRKRA